MATRQYVINGLIVITGILVVLGIVFAEPLVGMFAGAFRSAFREARTHRVPHANHAAVSFVRRRGSRVHGDAQLPPPVLHPRARPRCRVATIVCAFAVVPLMPMLGLPAIAGIAVGSLLGGAAQLAVQWPALRREGFVSPDSRLEG